MRAAALAVMLILLSAGVSAYEITRLETQGAQPAIYGETVLFSTFEDAADKDLNGDGDTNDHVIQMHDIRDKETKSLQTEGKNPAIFGTLSVFENDNRMLILHEKNEFTNTKARAETPSVHAKRVAFVTREQDVNLDLNGDSDMVDPIIRVYHVDGESTLNTKAVGRNPVIIDDIILFETSESEADDDLNKDGDKDDSIIRYYDLDEDRLINTRFTGTNPLATKGSEIVITDDNNFWTIDLVTLTRKEIGTAGKNPALYKDLIVFERGKKLAITRVSTGVEKVLDIEGTEPAIFEGTIAYVDYGKNIAIITGEDTDSDYIPDFADNCENNENEDQADKDKDNIGDACDPTDDPLPAATAPAPAEPEIVEAPVEEAAPPVTAQVAAPEPEIVETTERKPLPDTLVLQREVEDKDGTYWFLVAVGLTVIGIVLYIAIPRWMRKRRKSFGF
jgi:hypothetical protein